MIGLAPLISLIIIIPLLAFDLWMFRDMNNNPNIPANSGRSIKWPPATKYEWTLAFILLNIFAAIYYYQTEYRNRL